jgi:fructose-1-phosphate kinase PfkB-like protein
MTFDVVTVALNPVVDWTISIPDFNAEKVGRVHREQPMPARKRSTSPPS